MTEQEIQKLIADHTALRNDYTELYAKYATIQEEFALMQQQMDWLRKQSHQFGFLGMSRDSERGIERPEHICDGCFTVCDSPNIVPLVNLYHSRIKKAFLYCFAFQFLYAE